MRTVIVVILLMLTGCEPQSAGLNGRYQQITPYPLATLAILDTQTGIIYLRTTTGGGVPIWLEEHPHSGKMIMHQLDLEPKIK